MSVTIQKMAGLLICLLALSGCALLDSLSGVTETSIPPSTGKPTVPLDISIDVDTQAVQKDKAFLASLAFTTQRAIESAQGQLEVFGVVTVATSDDFSWKTIAANVKTSASAMLLVDTFGEAEIRWTVQVNPLDGKAGYGKSTRLYLLIAPEGTFARSDSTLQLRLDYLDYLHTHHLIDDAEYERRRTAVLGGGAITF